MAAYVEAGRNPLQAAHKAAGKKLDDLVPEAIGTLIASLTPDQYVARAEAAKVRASRRS